jgi:hypothetical protein
MWANNEVGSVQPIDEAVAIAQAHGIPVHSDAVQALGALPLRFDSSGLAAMTISAHKVGGPVGIGALILQRDLKPTPVLHGGGQEREVRSGTIPMPLIAGMAAAVEQAVLDRATAAARVRGLRERLVRGALALDLGAELRGHPTDRLPGNAHFTFAGWEGDALLMLLDAAGVQVSTGSACTAGIPQPSHVLLAMGIPETSARGALRFSLGRSTTDADVDAALASQRELGSDDRLSVGALIRVTARLDASGKLHPLRIERALRDDAAKGITESRGRVDEEGRIDKEAEKTQEKLEKERARAERNVREAAERGGRSERNDRSERPDRIDKIERPDRIDNSGRRDR